MEDFWIKNILNLIKDYSDYEDQREVWLGLSRIKVSSYDEELCMLFDDNEFDSFILEWKKGGKDKKTLDEMIRFRDMLNYYEDNIHQRDWTDEKVLNGLEWQKVVGQAKKVVNVWKIN
jgi:hypothetical protein